MCGQQVDRESYDGAVAARSLTVADGVFVDPVSERHSDTDGNGRDDERG